jgi:hypothetical protein
MGLWGQDCSTVVVVQPDDTCAWIAAAAGIVVSFSCRITRMSSPTVATSIMAK